LGRDDEAIIAELSHSWHWTLTAEMFLILPDTTNVLPLDVGLINGISQNYFSGESGRAEVTHRRSLAAWQPYCSVAIWYILALAGPSDTGRMKYALQAVRPATV
jgi:DNA-3-methyladenine glycosylase II